MSQAVVAILAAELARDPALARDARRLRALLNDLAPEQRRAINLIAQAAELGLAAELAGMAAPQINGLVRSRMAQSLIDEYSLIYPAAHWAVTAWISALGKEDAAAEALAEAEPPAGEQQAAITPLATLAGRGGFVTQVAWAPDGAELAVGRQSGSIRLWRCAAGHWTLRHRLEAGSLSGLAWTPSGTLLLSASLNRLCVWEARRGRLRDERPLAGDLAAWSADRRWLATVDGPRILIWPGLGASRAQATLLPAQPPALAMAWSHAGALLAASGAGGALTIWQMPGGAAARHTPGPAPDLFALAWSPDGQTLAAGGAGGRLELWPAAAPARPLQEPAAGAATIRSLAWSHDGSLLAAGDGAGTLAIWRASDGQLLECFGAHSGPVYALAWQPGGPILASGAADGTAKLWLLGRFAI